MIATKSTLPTLATSDTLDTFCKDAGIPETSALQGGMQGCGGWK